MKVVIIGGGTGGTEVAWRLRQADKEVEIVILEKGEHTQYSPCSLPYLISGRIKDQADIFLFGPEHYRENRIDHKAACLVTAIDRQKKEVAYSQAGKNHSLVYDRLVLAAGGSFRAPPIPGLDQTPYFSLKTIDDALAIKEAVRGGQKALIIGAGYVGLELAGSLRALGLEVVLAEAQSHILPATFDADMAGRIEEHVRAAGIEVLSGAQVENLEPGLAMINGQTAVFDHLFVCCGFAPDLSLAQAAGLDRGLGIKVDASGRTSDPDIFAVGDAVESVRLADGQPALIQLATTAVRQARTVAANIMGQKKELPGAAGTSLSDCAGLIFGQSGVSFEYCRANGIAAVSALYTGHDRSEYYPQACPLYAKVVAAADGRMLGCQLAGQAEIAGRLNHAALAVCRQMHLEEFISAETGYNPALAPIFDPLQVAAEICLKKIKAGHE